MGPAEGDAVYVVGDLVTRGPDGAGVLETLRAVGARSVIGNHEEKLLAARRERRAGRKVRLGGTHRRLLRTLPEADWEWLEALPRLLAVERHDTLVVHAGLVPGIPLEEQKPHWLTHLRAITDDGNPTSELGPVPWGARWVGPPHVVFGHNARLGTQLYSWATGLDTGCVYGGSLTGMVLDAEGPPPPVAERRDVLVSVEAARAYYDPGKLRAG